MLELQIGDELDLYNLRCLVAGQQQKVKDEGNSMTENIVEFKLKTDPVSLRSILGVNLSSSGTDYMLFMVDLMGSQTVIDLKRRV